MQGFFYISLMIKPPSLKIGDSIGIVAPGRKLGREYIDAAVKILSGWGLNVIEAPNLFSNKHAYLAGTDPERLEDFQSMIDDEKIKMILCARGGYGSTRIIEALNFSSLYKNPKWIVGFSDITAIHLKLITKGIQSIHGTMPVLFSREPESLSSLKKVLFGEDDFITAKYHTSNKTGNITAQTVGGNLSLIVDSLATSTELDTKGKILILEEIDEYLYRIDRLLMQLKRAGKLSDLAGLVIGHFTDIKDTEFSFGETFDEIINHTISEYNYPVAFNFPIGHENPNLAWRHGGTASLQVNTSGSSLTYLHEAI
jgi:muramoyltetrapeptide carboxypeptidase